MVKMDSGLTAVVCPPGVRGVFCGWLREDEEKLKRKISKKERNELTQVFDSPGFWTPALNKI